MSVYKLVNDIDWVDEYRRLMQNFNRFKEEYDRLKEECDRMKCCENCAHSYIDCSCGDVELCCGLTKSPCGSAFTYGVLENSSCDKWKFDEYAFMGCKN